MNNINILHPTDGDLRFLKKLIKDLSEEHTLNIEKIKLNKKIISHEIALNKIRTINEEQLLCIFCHGRSDGIYGCKFRPCHEPNLRYVLTNNDGLFIHRNNINLLKGKKIFCLACKSNGVGGLALAAGAKVFIGFDDINFDQVIKKPNILSGLPEEIHLARPIVHQKTKYLLRYCIFHSIKQGFCNKWTFYQFYDYLKVCLDQISDGLIINNKAILDKKIIPFPYVNIIKNVKCSKHAFHSHYKSAAICIQEIKDGLKIWGNGNLPLSNFG